MATGVATSFAIDADGVAWAWGANDTARLGHPSGTGPEGDLLHCGDSLVSACNPQPVRVQGLR